VYLGRAALDGYTILGSGLAGHTISDSQSGLNGGVGLFTTALVGFRNFRVEPF
jgi:isocitrate dehydrogenase